MATEIEMSFVGVINVLYYTTHELVLKVRQIDREGWCSGWSEGMVEGEVCVVGWAGGRVRGMKGT